MTIFSRNTQKPLPEVEDAGAAPPPKKQRKVPSDTATDDEIELTREQKKGISRIIETMFEVVQKDPNEEVSKKWRGLLLDIVNFKRAVDTDAAWVRDMGFVLKVVSSYPACRAYVVERLSNIPERARIEAAIQRNDTFFKELVGDLPQIVQSSTLADE